MPLYMLVKVDFGHRENVGLFDSEKKATTACSALELNAFDSGNLCGITYYIEEWFVQ